jgi:hypothetical protein
MIKQNTKPLYESTPESDLEEMWKDIKVGNSSNLCRNLLKAIAKNEPEVKTVEIEPNARTMWDSKNCKWVKFDIWGAIEIINNRKEDLLMQIYLPLPFQNEFGQVHYSWRNYDCSQIQEQLTDKEIQGNSWVVDGVIKYGKDMTRDYFDPMVLAKGDRQELLNEFRYEEAYGQTATRRLI